jgi:hypothetical protein
MERKHPMSDIESLLGDAPVTATKGQEAVAPSRPENIPESFWDAEKNELKTDDLLKSYDDAEKRAKGLRDKLAKGWQNVPEDPLKYAFELPDAFKETLGDGELNEDMVDFAKAAAFESGLSQEQFNNFMGKIIPQLHEYGISLDGKEPTPEELEAQQKEIQEAKKAEFEKLGEGGDRIIASVRANLATIKSQNIFTESELDLIQNGLGSSADGVLVLDKMFTKMFGQKTAITNFDVKASSFGIITEDSLRERLDDRRNSTNPDFYKETQRLIEQYGEQKKRMQK